MLNTILFSRHNIQRVLSLLASTVSVSPTIGKDSGVYITKPPTLWGLANHKWETEWPAGHRKCVWTPLSIYNIFLDSFHCHHYYCLLWHIYNGETHFLWLTASSFLGVQPAKEWMCARCRLRETHPSYESWPTKPDRKLLHVTHRTHQMYLLFIHFSVCLYFLHFTFRT